MGRPEIPRRVGPPPPHGLYKPAGVQRSELAWTTIRLDEVEALRLVDLDGLDQSEAAEIMGVSRQTVSRLLTGARRNLVEALVEGRGIRMEGGNVTPCRHQENRDERGHGHRRGKGHGRRRGRGHCGSDRGPSADDELLPGGREAPPTESAD